MWKQEGNTHVSPQYLHVREKQGDLRHEAEAGVDSQSLSFTHIGGVDDSFFSCGVVSGSVASLLLEKSNVRFISFSFFQIKIL